MRPGGTNLRVLGDLRRCSQTARPYNAYSQAVVRFEPILTTALEYMS
jgi:hypothetical protein